MTEFTNSFSEEVWRTKYRFGNEETVDDTFKRVATALASIEEDKEKWETEFYNILADFKFVPGGRITSNAGTGLTGTTLINCFRGDTNIITREGIKPLKELVDTDVKILSKHSQWVDASIKYFGKQRIYKLTVKKNKTIKEIYTTANHRWFAYTKTNRTPEELTTVDLRKIHRLEQVVSKGSTSTIPSPIGIAQGFTYGDGNNTKNPNSSNNVTLCGDKDTCMTQYFLSTPRQYGNNVKYNFLPNSWKNPPDLTENTSFLYGWLAGYFAADGCVSQLGECTISSTDNKNINIIKNVCSIIGIRYFKDKQQTRISNLTNRESILYTICLNRADLSDGFFIIPEHKQRFLDNQLSRNYHWKVISVEDMEIDDDVYCAIVPEKHSFALEGNILTGNCFVEGFTGEDKDSIEGIYNALYRQAKTLQSEGGYGFCCDIMRPKGSNIAGIGNQSPGAVKFLELWDKSSEIITAGSGKKARKGEKGAIRKGAQMTTISCWHPDVVEFIEAKKTPGRLTKFNMSVLCTDDFMNAVVNDAQWKLFFPNHKEYKKLYQKEWDGNIDRWIELCSKEKNDADPIVIYDTIPARQLWDLIMTNTYNRNEPGVLFQDTINRMNNLYYIERISSANPCGEQMLPVHGVCLLGSINLVHFIDTENKDWKYDELEKLIKVAVRMMDNVNDISVAPLKEQKQSMIEKRRIGLGVLGFASSLLMAKVPYGSKKSQELTKSLMNFIVNTAYKSSSLLAKEKEPFKLYDKDKYLNSNFVKKLDSSTQNAIEKYGIRNSHLCSIQPTGHSSVYANNVSSGLEPIFSPGYYRTAIQNVAPDGLILPKNIDFTHKSCDDQNNWKWVKEGDENILLSEFNDQVYKIDSNRGLTKEEFVEDYAVSYLKENSNWNEEAKYATFVDNLTVSDHVNIMSIFAEWTDSAISKTINLPNDYPYEDFKDVYYKAWQNGVKGFTTYRAGTMTHVLSTESSNKITEISNDAPKRPKELPCEVHHITVKGEPYFVMVGLLENRPYEVFAGKNGFMHPKVKEGTIIKVRKGIYKAVLDDRGEPFELSPITGFTSDEDDVVTRLVSSSLRHNIDLKFVAHQLSKSKGDLTNISKGIAKVLRKYIKEGEGMGEKCPECNIELSYMEGCVKCQGCGFSRC